jgi:hypothetical protein
MLWSTTVQHCTTWEELRALRQGELTEVEGQYEVRAAEMRPPGEEIVTASVIVIGGPGVLIGAYRTAESVRPANERASYAGKRVRVRGTFLDGTPWPHGGPVPGFWTGGGPQLVSVQRVELLET